MSDSGVETAERADAFGQVESHGIDAIPDSERHGQPRELAFLWAGAFVNYASLFTASLLTTYYGLAVWDGLLATAVGTVAAAAILGLLSNTGPRSGEPQIVFTRRIFGLRGSYLGAGLLGFMTCFALVASWYPFASDSSRYLPASSPTRSVTLWPVVGVAAPMLLLGIFGLLLPTIDSRLAADQGVLAVISAHAPG